MEAQNAVDGRAGEPEHRAAGTGGAGRGVLPRGQDRRRPIPCRQASSAPNAVPVSAAAPAQPASARPAPGVLRRHRSTTTTPAAPRTSTAAWRTASWCDHTSTAPVTPNSSQSNGRPRSTARSIVKTASVASRAATIPGPAPPDSHNSPGPSAATTAATRPVRRS